MVEITDVEDVKISNVKLATHPNLWRPTYLPIWSGEREIVVGC